MKGKPRINLPISKPTKTKNVEPNWRWWLIYIGSMLVLLWLWQDVIVASAIRTIPYSEFKDYLARHEVKRAEIRATDIIGVIVPKPNDQGSQPGEAKSPSPGQTGNASPAKGARAGSPGEFIFHTVRVEDPDLVNQLQAAGVEYTALKPGLLSQFLTSWVLPILVMVGLWTFISRRFAAAGQGVFGIAKSRARLVADKETGVKFDDVAGCQEAKVELVEVVDFLKDPARFQKLGARIPKGVLLVGPPGTGKTLLARAVAGEAGVPFFSISGSDFVEMFVGVGAARVRDLFQQAKQNAPCIIFIDELDAIGRQRGVHLGAVNDEREQTLNALLVEMDGFEPNTGVILLAATNRPEVLDRALMRPGRFDRQILVDAPDLDGREAILKVHSRNKPLAAGVNLRAIAQSTAGFSGADLANVLNEAALMAARRGVTAIHQQDLEEAIEKVVAGPERKSRRLSEEEKERVAYHEVGHALVAAYCAHADRVQKISIVPRGRAALGYTLQLPAQDQFLLTRSELDDRLRGLLGGRAAEEIIFGEASTGAQNDLERATALARQMVALYGMSEKVGLATSAQRPPLYAADSITELQRDCSEETARQIDEEVKKILARAYADANAILTVHRKQLEEVASELLKREALDGETFYRMIGRPVPSEKEATFPPVVVGSKE
ncbi:MAG: ATP-dependent zinc metalloprotease FtsH [Verrucomicrobia bacterium]|nr:ATP-dependent zinc metalloprotease FtsH [Verrucomicrobiota bacterium]